MKSSTVIPIALLGGITVIWIASAKDKISAAISGTPTIQEGSKGTAVSKWQQLMKLPADGIFGPSTTTATKTWQIQMGILANGIVDQNSWSRALGK